VGVALADGRVVPDGADGRLVTGVAGADQGPAA
jgi:hypothetical protein